MTGNVGTLQIQVTASDGAGGSVSDVFALTINPPATATLYRAINVNGAALVIDGNNWEAGATAPNVSYAGARAFSSQGVTLIPGTDANRATMIRSSMWGTGWSATMSAVPAGTYQVSIYVWEDNSPETFSVALEGTSAQSNYNSGSAGTWRKLGPFQRTINDGAINLTFSGGASNLSGIEVWRVGTPVGNQQPIVANPIADRSTTVGSPFSYTFPSNTFSDPDVGTALSYTASLSPTGSLPAWLGFAPATRTFSGTPTASDVATLQIQVTASDGAGGSVSDVFALTVNPLAAASLYRAININGPSLLIDGNNWEAGASATNVSFTGAMAFSNQAITLTPSTDANRTTMIRSSMWGWTWSATMAAVPAGTYQIWLYVWEDNSPETFSISLEGTSVQTNYNSGTTGRWSKLGPFQATINDGTINLGFTGGASNLSGIEVWRLNQQGAGARVAFNDLESSVQEDTPNKMDLSAFPNPFSEKVTVGYSVAETATTRLVLYDARGIAVRVLFEKTLRAGHSETLEIAVPHLPDGMYVLELMNGQRTKRIKVAISR
jgi:hypothetical protein